MKQETVNSSVLFCRISGLPFARMENLPWRAVPLAIPFSEFNMQQVDKIVSEVIRAGTAASIESRIFAFYSCLAKAPVEFRAIRTSPNLALWNSRAGQNILSAGLVRLHNFISYWNAEIPKVRAEFPIFRIHAGSDLVKEYTSTTDFPYFFSVLSVWEQKRGEFEKKFSPSDRNMKREAMRNRKLFSAIFEGDADALRIELQAEARRSIKGEKFSIFDSRHPQHKKLISVILSELADFYSIKSTQIPAFFAFSKNPQLYKISQIAEYKQRFIEAGAGREDTSPYHKLFIEWVSKHLDARRTMERKLQILEENELVQGKFVENIRRELGMPQRAEYSSEREYLSALVAWKKSRVVASTIVPESAGETAGTATSFDISYSEDFCNE